MKIDVRRPVLVVLTMLALVAAGLSATSPANAESPLPPPRVPTSERKVDPVKGQFAKQSKSGLWMVQLSGEPLASYQGGIAGLRATSPTVTGADQLNTTSARSRAYLGHLADQHDSFMDRADEELGREITARYDYDTAFNGMAVEVGKREAARLAELPGVVSVVPDELHKLDTDVSNEVISSPSVWEGETASGVGTRGEGVIVGALDTGINPEHPSFAAVDGDGYHHTNPFGAGNYVGVCDPDNAHYDPVCNDKLIGAWDFTAPSNPDVRDTVGHGSHTASTMAGNKHDAVITVGADEYTRTIQGVAPRANVIAYKVCSDFGCFGSSSVAAIDQAIADGVDVLNYSISGSDNPWRDSVDLAFLKAYDAGIFISASAGNTGPGEGTVAKTGPWNASVAATTHGRIIANVLDVTAPTPVPSELTGVAAVLGDQVQFTQDVEAPVRSSSSIDPGQDGTEGCQAYPAGAFDGAIALVERGGCNFSVKIDNAARSGAVGVVVFNQFGGPPVVMGEVDKTTIPSVMISNDDGVALRRLIADNGTTPTRVRIGADTTLINNPEWADILADFSARGPSQFDMLAPTFAAPGRNILAATAAKPGAPVQYEMMQGTSMSSPHGAGAGALLIALHPDWSPSEVRSALATSADHEGIRGDDGVSPAGPFEIGSGRLDLGQASRAGFVLDESYDDFVAANPATGGDPKALNLPAFVNQDCDDVCSWTRTFTSVADAEATYHAEVEAPDGMTVTVTPSEFTLPAGGTQEVKVSLDVAPIDGGDWEFGAVDFTTDDTHAGGAAISDAHLPIAVVPSEAELTFSPEEVSSVQDVAQQVTQDVTITNTGGADLVWNVDESKDCALPDWASVTPKSGTVPQGQSAELAVTFDSTDMSASVNNATLCLAGNDPHRPTGSVGLELEVIEIPRVSVTGGPVESTQPAGITLNDTLTITNTGYGTLDWTLADKDAGPSDERVRQLQDGVLLVPNSASANRGVMAFNRHNGELIDRTFIPHFPFVDGTLYTPTQVVAKPDGSGFLMSDQVNWMITEYDLEGHYQGIFAPISGVEDRSVMANIRGIAWSPRGTLLVTVATADNANSIIELDAKGNYLGRFVEPGLDGLDGPWSVLVRDNDVLVSASNSQAIHSYSLDGKTANPRFADGIEWPEQLAQLDNGNVLAANWRGASGAGVHEYDSAGHQVGLYTAVGSNYSGVYPLGNGNILTTTNKGVYEIDRAGGAPDEEFAGGTGRYISEVRMPDLLPCSTPDEVPWLSVSTESGSTTSRASSGVKVDLDSTGMDAGTYRAMLCLTNDDPDQGLVRVPVTMTVTDQVCTRTITGAYSGALTARTGTLCVAPGASVNGPVSVQRGAGLYAVGSELRGPIAASAADGVTLDRVVVSGPVSVSDTTGVLRLTSNQVTGPVSLQRNATGDNPIVVSNNQINGPLACADNSPPPVNNGHPNSVTGRTSGQCSGL